MIVHIFSCCFWRLSKWGSSILYNYSLFLQWSHSPHNSLTLTLPSSSGFFFIRLWNTMENARSPQLSPITGFDWNYLHACLLELWREREKGKEAGFGLLLQICVSVILTGGWQDMMELDGDTSLCVRNGLLQFIQVLFLVWECVVCVSDTKRVKSNLYTAVNEAG